MVCNRSKYIVYSVQLNARKILLRRVTCQKKCYTLLPLCAYKIFPVIDSMLAKLICVCLYFSLFAFNLSIFILFSIKGTEKEV